MYDTIPLSHGIPQGSTQEFLLFNVLMKNLPLHDDCECDMCDTNEMLGDMRYKIEMFGIMAITV